MVTFRYTWLVLLRTLAGTLAHTDWARALAHGGLGGLLREAGAALAGANAWPFFFPAQGPWSPDDVQTLLGRYGIASWGWGYHGGEYYCRVKLRQAHWAQYVLLAHDVPLGGRLLAGSSRAQTTGAAPRAQHRGPLDQIQRLVDRIAGL
jgi:hypothetical protein